MNLRFIDWIWNVRGSVALASGQSNEDAFGKLDPLFRQTGTSHDRTGDTLTFRKKDQASQDKMSIFDGGVLRIEQGVAGAVLRYRMTSRALLFCFLAPLLFLGIAQLTIAIGNAEQPTAEAAAKAAKEADAEKAKKKVEVPMNPIDKMLGAPEPGKPKKDEKDKKKEGKKGNKFSPTPAYVFAGIFAVLYLAGRILEDWLIRRLFRKKLAGA